MNVHGLYAKNWTSKNGLLGVQAELFSVYRDDMTPNQKTLKWAF